MASNGLGMSPLCGHSSQLYIIYGWCMKILVVENSRHKKDMCSDEIRLCAHKRSNNIEHK